MPRPNPEVRCETCDWWKSDGDDPNYARCGAESKTDDPNKHRSEWCRQHSSLPPGQT